MMKKMKLALWIILIVLIAVIFLSNKEYFFQEKNSIQIILPYIATYKFKEMPNIVYLLVFFVIGFLGAYFFNLTERFKSKKTIKNLNAAATSQLEEISALKKEMDSLKSGVVDNKTYEPEEQESVSTT
ncbi:MAG: LapA family protein [Desulfobacterales bacterium]